MGLPIKILISTLLMIHPLAAYHQGQVMYLMKSGDVNRAIDVYYKCAEEEETPPFELLCELAWALIQEGSRNSDPETKLLALFGASLTTEEQSIPYLLSALKSPEPQIQIAAINFLSRMNHDLADKEFTVGLASNNLIIRLETLLMMAKKKMPQTALQAESLMTKIPKELYPLFPPIFAQIADHQSLKTLRRFLSDPDDRVRASAIHSVEQTRRDEFLPHIRRLSKHLNPLIQEAAASCLGSLKDEKGRPFLEKLITAKSPEVKITALKSLYLLDDLSASEKIYEEAQNGNPYALNLLGTLPGYEDFLIFLSKHPDKITRANAAIALLERKNIQCVPVITNYLIEDSKDLALIPYVSSAKALMYWKPITSSREKGDEDGVIQEKVLRSKEVILSKVFDLPEKEYLQMAQTLFNSRQKALVPALVTLLENSGSDSAIKLLKKFHDKVGAPLVRQMCTLALFRLQEEGPYREELIRFVKEWKGVELIRFRPIIQESQDYFSFYQLTPEEISRMLIESLEALVMVQDNEAIDMILEAIREGHAKNRYALAGILIRATL